MILVARKIIEGSVDKCLYVVLHSLRELVILLKIASVFFIKAFVLHSILPSHAPLVYFFPKVKRCSPLFL